MKKYLCSLLSMLVISSLLVAAAGAYIKKEILGPMDLYQDSSVMELPFLMLSDDTLQYMVELSLRQEEAGDPTEPSPETQPPTELPTEPPQPTEAPTLPPETEPPVTEPELVAVDESWFDDALFIGNSLSVGLRDFGVIQNADYFCSVGMTVFNVHETWCQDDGGRYYQLKHVLAGKQYGKIYIHLGTNECGYPRDILMTAYQEFLDYIRENQPDAVIIIQGMLTTGRWKVQQYPYMAPEIIYEINAELEAMAQEENMRYIDFNPYIADEEGYLPYEWSEDGCHPHASGYQEWSQWIFDNAATLGIE